jgi:hypothetical protein
MDARGSRWRSRWRSRRGGLTADIAETILVLVVFAAGLADGGGLGGVTLAIVELVRGGVRGESVLGIVPGRLTAEEAREDAALLRVARSVVVSGARAEALLLAVVAGEGNLGEDREDEEDSITAVSKIDPFWSGRVRRDKSNLHGNDGHSKRGRLQTASRVEAG